MSELRGLDGTDFDGHRCRHLLGPEWMKRYGPGEAEKTRARGMSWGSARGVSLLLTALGPFSQAWRERQLMEE